MYFVLRFYNGAGNVMRDYRCDKPLVEWRDTMTRDSRNLIIERFDARDVAPFPLPVPGDITAALFMQFAKGNINVPGWPLRSGPLEQVSDMLVFAKELSENVIVTRNRGVLDY
jgi:hypothetical protein